MLLAAVALERRRLVLESLGVELGAAEAVHDRVVLAGTQRPVYAAREARLTLRVHLQERQ